MSSVTMFKSKNTCIAIKNDKLYVMSFKYKDVSPRAVTIASGFQIELGRDINNFIEALKHTRLPFLIKEVITRGDVTNYQIIRMGTGNVETVVVATIVCKKNLIHTVGFNRKLIYDSKYRRYNNLSVLHQLSIPFDLSESQCNTRTEQIKKTIDAFIFVNNTVEVVEKLNKLNAIVTVDEDKMQYAFVSNSNNNNRYELTSISLI